MKFRMAEKSLFAILLRSPWWISLALVGVMALIAKAALPPHLFLIGAMGGLPFLVIAVLSLRRQLKSPSPAQVQQTIEAARAMAWPAFAAALEAAWIRAGYSVQKRSASPSGADFTIERAGRVTLVSCKRWKAASLGIEPLRELQAAVAQSEASAGLCIALGEVTEQASAYAKEQGLQIMRGEDLALLL